MENLFINNGFVKLPRAILDWEWYDHPDVFRVMVHLILKVNYKPMKWQGHSIGIGEHITSIEKLSLALSLSKHKTRESLKKLSETGYIRIETTNQFTKVILLDSINYGLLDLTVQKPIVQQDTLQNKNNTKSNQNQTATNKKEKKVEELEERKDVFENKVLKFSNDFSSEHLLGFIEYWSTENSQTGRLRFEEDKFWDLELKIKSWKNYAVDVKKSKLTKNRPL
jgi:hypothetical protein